MISDPNGAQQRPAPSLINDTRIRVYDAVAPVLVSLVRLTESHNMLCLPNRDVCRHQPKSSSFVQFIAGLQALKQRILAEVLRSVTACPGS
jgi:hypothetical protein